MYSVVITHTHTRVSQYQKGETNLDFTRKHVQTHRNGAIQCNKKVGHKQVRYCTTGSSTHKGAPCE